MYSPSLLGEGDRGRGVYIYNSIPRISKGVKKPINIQKIYLT
jgi:hypothetical protein